MPSGRALGWEGMRQKRKVPWEAGAWRPGHNSTPELRAQPVPWKPHWFSGVTALALQVTGKARRPAPP